MPISTDFDIAIIGTGPAGLTAALAVARVVRGSDTAPRILLAGPPATTLPRDTRTTALMGASVALLKNLGAWDKCGDQATPFDGLRIIDATGNLLRAPDMSFRASEIQDAPFGYNIRNRHLTKALRHLVESIPQITLLETRAITNITIDRQQVCLQADEGGRYTTQLLIGADGRRSPSREAAGIGTKSWSYEQTAIACNFSHSRPHEGWSTEFHRSAGPFTTVPLSQNRSSLVWVERPEVAREIMALSDDAVLARMEQQMQGLLGTLSDLGPRASFPLSGQTAHRMGQNRTALVGEAAHVIPPIGAQGLNLSFRDAAWLAECIRTHQEADGTLAVGALLADYHRQRADDIRQRTLAVDLLNRSLISDFLPLHLARGLGLHLLNQLPPLRRAVMTHGLHPPGALPPLMQPSPAFPGPAPRKDILSRTTTPPPS